jgi:hypothetical protein
MPDAVTRILPWAVAAFSVALAIGLILTGYLFERGQPADDYPISRYDDQLELAKTGVPSTARVIEVKPTHTTLDSNPLVEATLEVAGSEGPYRLQTKQVIPIIHVPAFQPGATVSVRIDPRDKERIAVVF